MDTNLNKAFTIHSDLSLFEEKIRENKYSNLKNEVAKWLFTIATYIIYLMFISVSYAAPLLALQSYIELNASNVLAIVFIITLVFVAPAALSLAKHILYENVDSVNATQAQRKHLLMIVGFLIASGIYMEITSATSQQQEKAMQAVEHSKAGESIMNASVTVGGNNSESIAKAEFKLVSCQRKLKEGSVKDCDNSQAALKSLKEQSALDRAAASDANDKAIITKQATLDKERDSHALPIAKMFSDLFGIELSIGKVIAAIISAIIFETAHSLLILKAIKLEGEQKLLKDGFDQRKVDYFHVSGKQYKAGDFKESEVLDLSEMRNNGNIKHFADTLSDKHAKTQPQPSIISDPDFKITTKGQPYKDNKTGFGFVPQSAKQGLFKWELDEKPLPSKQEKSFGFIRHGQKAGDGEEILAASNRKNYPQTIIMPTGDGKTPDDYAPVQRVDTPRVPYTVGGNVTERNPLKSVNTVTPHDCKRPTLAEINKALSEQPLTGDALCPVCGVHVERRNIPNKRFCCKEHQKYHWKLKQKVANS